MYQTAEIKDFGLSLVYRHLETEVVYLGYAIKVGTRHESLKQHGMAHFVEHLLFKGTLKRSSKDIIQEIEGVGGELNAFTTKEETIVYCLAPKEYCSRAIDLLTDIVQNSQFPEAELEKEKGVVIDEIYSYEDSPSELIFDEFENQLFRGHRLGHNILGTERSVRRFNTKHCQDFYHRHYRLDNMVFFAQGDFQEEELKTYLRNSLQEPKEVLISEDNRREKALGLTPKSSVVRRKGTHQCHILFGNFAYAQNDERKLALSLLTNILGGGSLSSRLNTILREEHGLVYQTEANYTAYSDTGIITVYAACSKKNESLVIELIEKELDRLKKELLSEELLSQAKQQFIGQLMLSAENRENIFLSMGKSFLHYGKVESLQELKEHVKKIDAQDLFDIAKELFRKEDFARLIYK